MIVQLRREDRYSLNIITYWTDIAHIMQVLPSVDKEKLQYSIEHNTKYNENGDYFIQLK
jgi:hypothetical protein